MTVYYDILAIVCLNVRCVSECMYVSMCIYVYLCIYVCMYDVRHDIQIPCTRYVAINRLLSLSYVDTWSQDDMTVWLGECCTAERRGSAVVSTSACHAGG